MFVKIGSVIFPDCDNIKESVGSGHVVLSFKDGSNLNIPVGDDDKVVFKMKIHAGGDEDRKLFPNK